MLRWNDTTFGIFLGGKISVSFTFQTRKEKRKGERKERKQEGRKEGMELENWGTVIRLFKIWWRKGIKEIIQYLNGITNQDEVLFM